MLRALIDAGADLERPGTAVPGATALGHAVEYGMTACVDVLVAAGAVVEGPANTAGAGQVARLRTESWSDQDRFLAWRAAARCGRLQVAEALLDRGVDIHVHKGDRASALHWAAYHGQVAMVRYLLDRRADPNSTEITHGLTPLGWARHRRSEIGGEWGHAAVIAILEPVTNDTE